MFFCNLCVVLCITCNIAYLSVLPIYKRSDIASVLKVRLSLKYIVVKLSTKFNQVDYAIYECNIEVHQCPKLVHCTVFWMQRSCSSEFINTQDQFYSAGHFCLQIDQSFLSFIVVVSMVSSAALVPALRDGVYRSQILTLPSSLQLTTRSTVAWR